MVIVTFRPLARKQQEFCIMEDSKTTELRTVENQVIQYEVEKRMNDNNDKNDI